MRAKDVMTRNIVSVAPDATGLQAARLMLQHHISGLPVVDASGKLVGILSEGDFLRRRETSTQRRRSRWLEFLMGPGKIASEYTQSHGRTRSPFFHSSCSPGRRPSSCRSCWRWRRTSSLARRDPCSLVAACSALASTCSWSALASPSWATSWATGSASCSSAGARRHRRVSANGPSESGVRPTTARASPGAPDSARRLGGQS